MPVMDPPRPAPSREALELEALSIEVLGQLGAVALELHDLIIAINRLALAIRARTVAERPS